MIGDPGVEVETENVTTWQINQAWATRYSKDRVFCGSDAVHRHPPSSGPGSNTSIQDAFNLAYAVKGWAGPGLLESYSAERAPVGAQVVACANQSRIDYGPINAAFRTEGQANPSPRAWPSSATPARTGRRPTRPSSRRSSTRTPSSTPRAPNSTSATNPRPPGSSGSISAHSAPDRSEGYRRPARPAA